jgi:hypothetical protein
MRKGKPIRLFSMFMVLAMFVLALPIQAFADTAAESRLARVDFSTPVELSSTFSPDTYSYSATVKSSESTITLTPYAMDSAVTIRVNGNQVTNGSSSLPITLQQGGNIITVVVQSVRDPNSVKNYVITIYRSSDLFNADLKTLVVEGAELYQTFAPVTTSYTGRVKPSQAYVVVKPTAYDYATIKVNGVTIGSNGYMLVDMSTGINTITIEVTSQSGSTKTYSIQLNRPTPNDNANLSSLVIGGKTYTETGTTYVGYVGGNATSVDVVINASDPLSTIDLDGQIITSGSSTNLYLKKDASIKFTITVKASNGTTTKTYNLYIIRQGSTDTNTGSSGSNSSNGSTSTSLTVDSSGVINVSDGKGATAIISRSGGIRTYTVTLSTDSIKKAINDNSKAALLVVDYSKMTTINDVLVLNVDGTLSQLLQSKKIPVKLMALNGYVTADLTQLNNWISGGSLTISRNNIGANFGKEYIPSTGFINFSHTGTVSSGAAPFNIEIPVYSDGDLKLANVYRYNGSQFTVIPSTTSNSSKKANAVGAGDYIVMNFKKSFTDINNHWSYNLLDFMAKKQIISGYPDDTFKPDRYVTRAEFTSMLVKAINEKQKTINAADAAFIDVMSTDWCYPVVNTAWKSGLVTGVTATTFEPDKNITREQMAAIAVRALKQLKTVSVLTSTQADNILGSYTDAKNVSAWAKVELATAINNKIMEGVGQNNLASQDLATRAQAAVIVYKVLNESSSF